MLLIPTCVSFATILVALPPNEPGDLVSASLPMRELGVKVVQHLVGRAEAIVVLLAGVPVDRLGRRVLFPAGWRVFISGIDITLVLKPFAARWKVIPSLGTIARRCFQDQYRLIVVITDDVTETEFGTDLIATGPA